MWSRLFFQQLHFSINLIAALVIAAIAWLYFDAWLVRKSKPLTFYLIGFLLLSLSFLLHAATIELPTTAPLFLSNSVLHVLFALTRVTGYISILVALLLDPIQAKPDTKKILDATSAPVAAAIIGLDLILPFPLALASGLIGFLFFKKATIGLENHLKPIAYSFFLLASSEAFSIFAAFRNTTNITIYNMVAPFGILWIIEHLLLIGSIFVLRKWLFGYLLKRFEAQLFMIFASTVVFVYLITTVTFTSLLLKNVQDESLLQLKSNVHVLGYALENKKENLLSDAQLVAQNQLVKDSMISLSQGSVRDLASQFLISKKLTTLIIVNKDARVVARAEQTERLGDSLSSNTYIQTALQGKEITSVVTQEGVLTKELLVKAAVPIMVNNQVVGAVIAGTSIDNAFLDGIKKETSLDSTIYVDDTIAATTLVASDNITRPIGVKEKNTAVKKAVLDANQEYASPMKFLGKHFLGAYIPLLDSNNSAVGMLFLGREEAQILTTATKSIELTFAISIALLIASIVPVYLLSRHLTRQI